MIAMAQAIARHGQWFVTQPAAQLTEATFLTAARRRAANTCRTAIGITHRLAITWRMCGDAVGASGAIAGGGSWDDIKDFRRRAGVRCGDLRGYRVGLGRQLCSGEVAAQRNPQTGRQGHTNLLHLAPPFRFAAKETLSAYGLFVRNRHLSSETRGENGRGWRNNGYQPFLTIFSQTRSMASRSSGDAVARCSMM